MIDELKQQATAAFDGGERTLMQIAGMDFVGAVAYNGKHAYAVCQSRFDDAASVIGATLENDCAEPTGWYDVEVELLRPAGAMA